MSKLIKVKHIKGANSVSSYDVDKVRSMSDSEAEERAKSDPDAQPITARMIKKPKASPTK
jgi:hypothetical protein